jgi:hypothetical protein
VLTVPFGVRIVDDGLPVLLITAGNRAPTAFLTMLNSRPPVEELVLLGDGKMLVRTDDV